MSSSAAIMSPPPRYLLHALFDVEKCLNLEVQCRLPLHRKPFITTSYQHSQDKKLVLTRTDRHAVSISDVRAKLHDPGLFPRGTSLRSLTC
jgi:hypothetical protein